LKQRYLGTQDRPRQTKKKKKWGSRLYAIAESDTGYVNSIIPNYRKLTGDVCNLPYSENPFFLRKVLSLMDRL
jgi:hypothetical protein